VLSDITVAELGCTMQIMFMMNGYHLMAIDVPVGRNYNRTLMTKFPDTPPDSKLLANKDMNHRYMLIEYDTGKLPDYGSYKQEIKDIMTSPLKEAVSNEGDRLAMDYDFGDGWRVSVKLEKVIIDDEIKDEDLPRVIKGKNYGIAEDIGGVGGLERLMRASKGEKDEDYEEYEDDWFSADDFDITEFDIDEINDGLKEAVDEYIKDYKRMLYH
jgi:hypothetical protein